MIENFTQIMAAIYTLEGGFSNDPRDPGGMTNLGVTARSWAAWKKVPLSTVTAAMMQALTQSDTNPLYRANYWNLIDGDALPAGVDAMIMHFEVNAGGVAARELQSIVGVDQDGVIGPGTLGAIASYIQYTNIGALLQAIANSQTKYYQADPKFPIYGDGWLRRIAAMLALGNRLALVSAAMT